MRSAPPYRLALATAFLGATIGWILGHLMAGPFAPVPPQEERTSDSTERTLGPRIGRGVLEQISNEPTGPDNPPANATVRSIADFDIQAQRALRIPDPTGRLVRLRDLARSLSLADLPAAVEVAKRCRG